jgi:hypothetical protein
MTEEGDSMSASQEKWGVDRSDEREYGRTPQIDVDIDEVMHSEYVTASR